MLRAARYLSISIVILGVISCDSSSTLYPVEGSIFFNDRPAEGALVVFFPEVNDTLNATVPSATVAKDGSFKLDTNGKPGAPAGKYKVVVKIAMPPGKEKTLEPPPIPGDTERKAPEKYVQGPFADRTTTTLTADVKKTNTQLEPIRLP